MKYVLFMMFFITPVHEGGKSEAKNVWALQSTSQIDFDDMNACKKAGADLTNSIDPVNNLTMTAWCICKIKNDPECSHERNSNKTILEFRNGSGPVMVPIPSHHR